MLLFILHMFDPEHPLIQFTHNRTRRRWEPNVQKVNFYSELLEESVSIPVTTRALRTIDKKGGIDNYILFSKPSLYEGSEVAESLFQQLRFRWEEREQRPFSRSQEVLNARLEGLRLDRPFQIYVREKEEKEKQNKNEDSQSKTASTTA
jgi:ribosomal protein L28